jgi:hypothetical protein
MANGGDKGHHSEKKVDRKESRKQPKTAAVAGVKTQAATKERAQ